MLRRQQVDLESAEFDLSHDAATGGVMLQRPPQGQLDGTRGIMQESSKDPSRLNLCLQ
jgi:hypothetical protein